MEIRSDRTWRFDATPSAVWAAIDDPEAFPTWWPWLRDFDGRRVATGEVWRCVVQPPLPYRLGFALTFGDVRVAESVEVTVAGDIVGTAGFELHASGDDATEVHIRSALRPGHPAFVVAATLLGPLARWGHDWVLDTGARQFADRAL